MDRADIWAADRADVWAADRANVWAADIWAADQADGWAADRADVWAADRADGLKKTHFYRGGTKKHSQSMRQTLYFSTSWTQNSYSSMFLVP